jgi:hypothetical protein
MSGTLEEDREPSTVFAQKNIGTLSLQALHHSANLKPSLVQKEIQGFR